MKENKTNHLFVKILVISTVVLLLYPYTLAGYFFDDIYNSVLNGYLIANNLTLREYAIGQIQLWIDNGRLYPLAAITGMWSWHYFDTLLQARYYQISMAVLNIFIWYLLIRELLKSELIPLISILLLSCTIQFNPRWDGLTSFQSLNQLVFAFINFSALFLIYGINKFDKINIIFIVCSLFLSTCALLTYEIGIISIILNILILLTHGKNHSYYKKLIRYFLLILIVYISVYQYFSMKKTSVYDGIQFEIGLKVIYTFLNQIFSAFPLAFMANDIMIVPPIDTRAFSWIFIIYFLAFFLVLLGIRNLHISNPGSNRYKINFYQIKDHIFVSLIYLIIPGLLISLSKRYQNIITYGDPYIVVYIQFYGVSLLLSIIITEVVRYRNNYENIILFSLIGAFIASITVNTNYERIKIKNKEFKDPRVAIERLIEAGFMSNLQENAVLLVNSSAIWESEGVAPGNMCSSFFSQHLRKKINCTGVNNFSLNKFKIFDNYNEIFYLQRKVNGELISWELQGNGKYIYASYSLKLKLPVINIDSQKRLIVHQLSHGFYGWENSTDGDFTWANGNSTINLLNLSSMIGLDNIKLSLISAVDQLLVISLNGKEIIRKNLKTGELFNFNNDIYLNFGNNFLDLKVNGSTTFVNSDPRELSFFIKNLKINEKN
jgi:hypothetical protein